MQEQTLGVPDLLSESDSDSECDTEDEQDNDLEPETFTSPIYETGQI